jgi:subtilisin family serine protease
MATGKLGYLLAVALMVGVLLASSGAASGQQDGWSPARLGFASEPEQSTGRDYVPQELIVGLKEGVSRSSAGLERAAVASDGRVKDELQDPLNRAVLLKFPSEQAARAAVDELEQRPDVQYVERNGIVEGGSISTDPLVGYQWHHTVIRKSANLGALSSTPPTIAVVDTGVDYNHPDLDGNIWTNPGEVPANNIDDDDNGYVDDVHGYDFVNNDGDPMDDNSHGTHVAGIAAGEAGNGAGVEGVSPKSRIVAVKVLGAGNSGTAFITAKGLAYTRTVSTTPATKIVNASLGGSGDVAVQREEVAALKTAGKVLVASAGNGNSTTPFYPAADPNTALRVMNTTQQDCRAFDSNFSPSSNPTRYNIAAPGDYTLSTVLNNGYADKGGTSMATPMVAGAAALVWGTTPSLTRKEVVNKLVNNGEPTTCGFAVPTPRLDVRKAIRGTTETALVGQLLDPATGTAPLPETTPATAKLYAGTTLLHSDATNASGFYEMTGLAAGTGRQLKDTRSGYVSATLRRPISIASGQVAGPLTDALPAFRPTGNATVTIDWKTIQPITDTAGCVDACNGWDFDLIVKLPDGTSVDPVNNKGSLAAALFVNAPRDSYGDYSPVEGVVIGIQAANGTYKVVADKWPDPAGSDFNPSWSGSQASVQMYNGDTSIGGGLKTAPSTCGNRRFWYIGDLAKSGSSYTFTNKNVCTNTEP